MWLWDQPLPQLSQRQHEPLLPGITKSIAQIDPRGWRSRSEQDEEGANTGHKCQTPMGTTDPNAPTSEPHSPPGAMPSTVHGAPPA